MDEVNLDHAKLTSKYDWLIHCNDYFAKLAEQIITITELNSCLQRADEKDRDSICLMGTLGPKTLGERQNEQQIHKIQQKLDDLEKSEAGTSNMVNNPAAIRPKSGMSHFSKGSHAPSIRTNHTRANNLAPPHETGEN